MAFKALVVLAFLAFTYGQLYWESSPDVTERLKIPPVPMPGFNLLPWLGQWFYQYLKVPCSWAIAAEFTDFTHFTEVEGQNVINHDAMRNRGVCNTVTSIFSITGPGEFIGKDVVGNNWSGRLIVVATDYKSFSVTWGCTKMSEFDNRCEDSYVFIKTRQLRTSARVLRRIDMVLRDLWGISARRLTKMPHGRPCSSGRKKMG
ncbi:uncharacterized protein LOC123554889 [Mercenaria mercenaria]|uniref:uncharacterized protein LOC123554889 n=1 Tax=Mercenaria mercenaria TaxID=6596 RepID=UPI00234F4F80|nr:uncharacterized protein LOC123554889 [Mercenaria mercenaria]